MKSFILKWAFLPSAKSSAEWEGALTRFFDHYQNSRTPAAWWALWFGIQLFRLACLASVPRNLAVAGFHWSRAWCIFQWWVFAGRVQRSPWCFKFRAFKYRAAAAVVAGGLALIKLFTRLIAAVNPVLLFIATRASGLADRLKKRRQP